MIIMLDKNETQHICGGITVGTAIIAAIAGFVTGGPVGAGIAVSGIIAAQGIDNLNNLLK